MEGVYTVGRSLDQSVDVIPWDWDTVVMFVLGDGDEEILWANRMNKNQKRKLLDYAVRNRNSRFFIAWPGKWRQDLIELTREETKALRERVVGEMGENF